MKEKPKIEEKPELCRKCRNHGCYVGVHSTGEKERRRRKERLKTEIRGNAGISFEECRERNYDGRCEEFDSCEECEEECAKES